MSLVSLIELDLTNALKSGDTFTRDTLRFLKSVIKNAEIDSGGMISDEQIVTIVQKEIKKRAEAQTIYNQANKPDLAKNEATENELLKKYLPEQIDEEQIKLIIVEYLASNPTKISAMGAAMGVLSSKLRGKADLGLVSKILREKIQND